MHVVYFKAIFHNLHIRVKKDSQGIWYKFPYLVTKDDIIAVVSNWSSDWMNPFDVSTRLSKIAKGEVAQTTMMIAAKKKKEA